MEQAYRFIEMLFALERVALYKNAFLSRIEVHFHVHFSSLYIAFSPVYG